MGRASLPASHARVAEVKQYVHVVYRLNRSEIEFPCVGLSSWCGSSIMSPLIEQSNRTPRCSRKVSAAGLPWLEHFRVQCYM